MMSGLKLAQVTDVHPEANAVDLIFLDTGSRVPMVQVMSGEASTSAGLAALVAPENSAGKWSTQAGEREIIAVVGFIRAHPIVMGFLFPQVAECLFSEKNRRIFRHPSDVYTIIDDNGDIEVYHPSGTFFRIGENANHLDLTGQDFDQKWAIKRNTGKAVGIKLVVANAGAVKSTLGIDAGGNVSLNNTGTITVVAGGAATLTMPTMTINAVTTINGNTFINGALAQAGGNADFTGGNMHSTGKATFDGGVKGTTVELDTHKHREQGDGNLVSLPIA